MEFLVHIVIDPAGLAGDEGAARLAAERERALDMIKDGTMRRMWRIPGTTANWAVFDVEDATALHDLLASMPLFGYLTVEVHPLAHHPIERMVAERG